jgi:hypothetical protein
MSTDTDNYDLTRKLQHQFKYSIFTYEPGSSVSIESGYRLDGRAIKVRSRLVDLYFCKCAGRPNLQKACFEHI